MTDSGGLRPVEEPAMASSCSGKLVAMVIFFDGSAGDGGGMVFKEEAGETGAGNV